MVSSSGRIKARAFWSDRDADPLLQRASTVGFGTHVEPANLQVSISPKIPAYSTGWSYYQYMPITEILDWDTQFLPILYEHLRDAPM